LGFQLKPNSYRKEDWKWLIEKLEKILNDMSFRWLSKEGILTLTKSVFGSHTNLLDVVSMDSKRSSRKN
jgi:hypothetical protein